MEPKDAPLQLYKMEYEKAADRYDNIYRSLWTIFSYLTVVSAGLLTFGSERIEPHALVCISLTPLLFWFLTTYLPLDRYGTEVLNRLGKIENLVNSQYGTSLGHFKPGADKELSVFRSLCRVVQEGNLKEFWNQLRRARFMICSIFIVLILVAVCEAVAFRRSGKPLFSERPVAEAVATPTRAVVVRNITK